MLGITIALVPLSHVLFDTTETLEPIKFLKMSNLWLAPFQGLATATLGGVLGFKQSSDQ